MSSHADKGWCELLAELTRSLEAVEQGICEFDRRLEWMDDLRSRSEPWRLLNAAKDLLKEWTTRPRHPECPYEKYEAAHSLHQQFERLWRVSTDFLQGDPNLYDSWDRWDREVIQFATILGPALQILNT